MAVGHEEKPCSIVLHDDRVSTKDILSGTRVLHLGEVGYLSAPGATTLCVTPAGLAANSDEISVHVALALRFGFGNRVMGTICLVEDVETATASHVELFFKDQSLSRADMWQLMGVVDETVLYQGQTLHYLGSPSAEVQHIYVGGLEVHSAFVAHPHTKSIFRSASARFTFLIEISDEMLAGWMDGELMYERLVDGFLPDLFCRWEVLKARHVISIVLFGRAPPSVPILDDGLEGTSQHNDFFWVLVSELPCAHWRQMMQHLKRAFNSQRLPPAVSLSSEANLLEAIHMAALHFADERDDTRPMSTGSSIIAITAGAGMFDASHALLKQTTDLLIGNSIGVDIVALSPKPLHPVPLFRYTHQGVAEYALPHWVDISFWTRPEDMNASKWIMPGAEEPVDRISIPFLSDPTSRAPQPEDFDEHDEIVFHEQVFEPVLGMPSNGETSQANKSAKLGATSGPPPATSAVTSVDDRSLVPVMSQDSTSMSFFSAEVSSKPKRHALPPLSLMNSGRKISLGPKGLAPGRSVASTTVSAAHVQHEMDFSLTSLPNPSGASSGIAKAIRASLARKPSQQSLTSHRVSEPDQSHLSRPIDIFTGHESLITEPADPATLVEQKIADTMVAAALEGHTTSSHAPSRATAVTNGHVDGVYGESLDMLSPWVLLLNPCNPRRDNMKIASQYRKWQHVFPRAISSGAFKWASMCSPAALPTTAEYRPTVAELGTHYEKKIRRHVISHSPSLREVTARVLIERLINIRLVRGFQMVAIANSGSGQAFQSREKPVLLALGRRYHELQRLSDFEVQIVQYEPKVHDGAQNMSSRVYQPSMCMPNGFTIKPGVEDIPQPTTEDWTPLDEHILGLAALPETSMLFKLRLVLLPVEISRTEHGAHLRSRELTDEEHRIEGIQKLTQTWQRQRYFSPEDRDHQVSLTKSKTGSAPSERDLNLLAIDYQTRDPSLVVNSQGPGLSTQLNEDEIGQPLFADSEKHHSSNFDINKLVKQMQELPPFGIPMRDRRWLTQTHPKCFRGDEMTSWLLGAFKDLEDREDAVTVGNELMNRGILSHVRNKHRFRDGHYFYQITAAHRTTDYPDSTGLFSKAPWRSIPQTPISESITSPLARPVSGDSSSSLKATPTIDPSDPSRLLLSQMLQYNVDASRKSDHLHVIDLHYDRIHNPDNCYHIQLEWLGASAKLIRDAISRWSALVEHHGLKLLQLPLQEASMYPKSHPFDQPQPIKLAIKPPDRILATPLIEPHGFSPRVSEDRSAPYKLLLRKKDFVLDYEAASAFSSKLHVTYSWGPLNYQYTQFVHRSGLVIAQIVRSEDVDFLLLPNPLASSRLTISSKMNESDVAAQDIIDSFEDFCHDEEGLKQIYKQMENPRAHAPSPLSSNVSATDIDVPPMQLPPHIMHRSQAFAHLHRPLG